MTANPIEREAKRLCIAGFLLGFALGGFFDGILLHQILQWHHLLSALENERLDLRFQILADGLFHAAMYLVALAGLYQMWRARAAFNMVHAGKPLIGYALIGFGLWHIIDAILSHWLLGIHRIRMDTDNPLLWDLIWFALFGLVPVAIGWILQHGTGPGAGSRPRSGEGAAAVLVMAVSASALISARAPETGDVRMVTVVMRGDAPPRMLLAALPKSGGRVLWSNTSGDVWVLAFTPSAQPARLYAHGALFISGTTLPAGCSAWIRS